MPEQGVQTRGSLWPGTSGRHGLEQGNVRITRTAPASKTIEGQARAPDGDVDEHVACERLREAGGLRVAQEEQGRCRVLCCEPSQCLLC